MNISASGGMQANDIGGLWGTSSAVGGKDWTWEAPAQSRIPADITPSVGDVGKLCF